MDDIIGILGELGLNPLEIKVFLLILELGSSTVVNLAKAGELKRTNLYNVLDSLEQLGLVSETYVGSTRYFQASPYALLRNEKEKKRKLGKNIEMIEDILPSLEAMCLENASSPKVRYFKGKSGVASLLDQILQNESFDAFFNPRVASEMYPKVIGDFLKKTNENKFKIRELLVQNSETKEYLASINNPNYEYRLLPKKFEIKSDTLLFGDKVTFISYQVDTIGIVIESKDIVQSQKMAFEIMWESLG